MFYPQNRLGEIGDDLIPGGYDDDLFGTVEQGGDPVAGAELDQGILRTLWLTPDELRASRERLRSLARDLNSLTDQTSYLGNNVTFLLDSAVGLINTDQNEIMKVFSVWAVVLMPPTLIGSIYGMNFKHMPELSQPWGYPVALVLMAATMLLPLWWFRKRGWL